ncbi:hypothetical protein WL88_29795 [Burkholderia diffusa]|uniref:Uncharacterized protein n=1 Tax=Burkholderia diffusa TaxID=488732 RepID=A0AAW3P5X1_9BURK|nr:hypothetical protein WL86_26355 [Burkholderia diffusa]KWF33893.1 hypothetical protein WL85_18075 [Burkholderia diffusa]KWF43982.1 hypothetical protein WL88_29795 [Burkholderia diffusa]KWF54239.1 hypothetical protein WL87_12250 [Burkholderia diffusa]
MIFLKIKKHMEMITRLCWFAHFTARTRPQDGPSPACRLHEVVKKCYRRIDLTIGIPVWNLPY